jgi:hypothetical protein
MNESIIPAPAERTNHARVTYRLIPFKDPDPNGPHRYRRFVLKFKKRPCTVRDFQTMAQDKGLLPYILEYLWDQMHGRVIISLIHRFRISFWTPYQDSLELIGLRLEKSHSNTKMLNLAKMFNLGYYKNPKPLIPHSIIRRLDTRFKRGRDQLLRHQVLLAGIVPPATKKMHKQARKIKQKIQQQERLLMATNLLITNPDDDDDDVNRNFNLMSSPRPSPRASFRDLTADNHPSIQPEIRPQPTPSRFPSDDVFMQNLEAILHIHYSNFHKTTESILHQLDSIRDSFHWQQLSTKINQLSHHEFYLPRHLNFFKQLYDYKIRLAQT